MTGTKLVEYRITRQLLQGGRRCAGRRDHRAWVDRLIAILAVTAGLFVVGSYFQELVWAVVAGATLTTLR